MTALTTSASDLAEQLRVAAEIGLEQVAHVCTRRGRAADVDTELLVVVLGCPMCRACSEQVADEQDAGRAAA